MASAAGNPALSGPYKGSTDSDRLLRDHPDRLDDDDHDEMALSRPPLHRPGDARSQQPLLKDEHRGRLSNTFSESSERGLARPGSPRRSNLRSRTPDYEAKNLTRRKYIYAAFFLLLSLVSFVVQTETAVYIQHKLHWDKPYAML